MAKHIIKILVFLLLFLSSAVSAQGRDVSSPQDSLGNAVKVSIPQKDTVLSSGRTDSLSASDTMVYVMHKSPWGAVLRSALIPGWGQFYNHSYWKIPVVWGFIGYFSYIWIDNNNKYRDVPSSASAAVPGSRYAIRPDLITSDSNFYRDQRDLFAIYIGLTYALNLLDAYVDAQLFDFSVEEDTHTGAAMFSVKFHF